MTRVCCLGLAASAAGAARWWPLPPIPSHRASPVLLQHGVLVGVV